VVAIRRQGLKMILVFFFCIYLSPVLRLAVVALGHGEARFEVLIALGSLLS